MTLWRCSLTNKIVYLVVWGYLKIYHHYHCVYLVVTKWCLKASSGIHWVMPQGIIREYPLTAEVLSHTKHCWSPSICERGPLSPRFKKHKHFEITIFLSKIYKTHWILAHIYQNSLAELWFTYVEWDIVHKCVYQLFIKLENWAKVAVILRLG